MEKLKEVVGASRERRRERMERKASEDFDEEEEEALEEENEQEDEVLDQVSSIRMTWDGMTHITACVGCPGSV